MVTIKIEKRSHLYTGLISDANDTSIESLFTPFMQISYPSNSTIKVIQIEKGFSKTNHEKSLDTTSEQPFPSNFTMRLENSVNSVTKVIYQQQD